MPKNNKCGICHNVIRSTSLKTPCNHIFHKKCLGELIQPTCPMCRKDIHDFLIEKKISSVKKLQKKQSQAIIDDIHYDHDDYINTLHINDISQRDKCIEAIQKSFILYDIAAVFVYRDILLDLIRNCGTIYCKISEIKHKDKKGVFFYRFNKSKEIINYLTDASPSKMIWGELDEFKHLNQLYNLIDDTHKEITDTSKEFVVAILWNLEELANPICTCVKISNQNTKRLHTDDILLSMLKVDRVYTKPEGEYYIDNNLNPSPNKEYTYAKQYLKNLNYTGIINEKIDRLCEWHPDECKKKLEKCEKFKKESDDFFNKIIKQNKKEIVIEIVE